MGRGSRIDGAAGIRRRLWSAMPLVGGVLGGLACLGVVAAAALADADLFRPVGTPTDPWPSDAEWLAGVLLFATPFGVLIGAAVSTMGYAVAIRVSRGFGYWWGSAAGGIIIGAVALLGGAALSVVTRPPAFTPLVVAILIAAGALLWTRFALRMAAAARGSFPIGDRETVAVVGRAGQDDDPVDERPDAERRPAEQELRDPQADVSEVEAVDAEAAQEEAEDRGDGPALR